jgi:glutathione S-transferase
MPPSLELYYHPLASYCWKVLIALYENGTAFEPKIVDLMDPEARTEFSRLAPLGKFPVLRDRFRGNTVYESSIIVDYLDEHYPGVTELVPADREQARRTRFWDRFFDLYVHEPMQKIVLNRLRPERQRDAHGVELARAALEKAYCLLDAKLGERTWAVGQRFTIADCAAAPALYYANRVAPLGDRHAPADAYLARLLARPSSARVIAEAQPYFAMFPESELSDA